MQSTVEKQPITRDAPGPRGCPFVGSLPFLAVNILKYLENISAKYGDIVLYKLGRKKVYLISHPKQIASFYTAERNGHYGKKFFHEAYKPAFGNGILNSDGEDWKRQREILQPYFQKKEVVHWFPLIQDETRQFLESLAASDKQNTIQVEKAVLPLVQSIMCRILFGRPLQDEDSRKAVDAINTVSKHTLIRSIRAFVFNGVFNRLPTPGNLKYQKALDTIDQSLLNLREKAKQQGDGQSLITKLATHFGQQELRDHLFTLFFGGQDTTVNALAFTLYYLGRYPKIQQQARDEIFTVLSGKDNLEYADLKRLHYTESVIAESMRLAPPAYAMSRDVVGDQQINDTLIRDDSLIVVSPYLTHRRADLWDEPEKFDPERFMQGKQREKFTFFPYGGGMHTCLGLNLARVEILTVIAMFLTRFQCTIPEGFKLKMETYMTLRTKNGIDLEIKAL